MKQIKELKEELEYQLDLKYWACGDKLFECIQKIKTLRKQIRELERESKNDKG